MLFVAEIGNTEVAAVFVSRSYPTGLEHLKSARLGLLLSQALGVLPFLSTIRLASSVRCSSINHLVVFKHRFASASS